jgi:hypothetical protein
MQGHLSGWRTFDSFSTALVYDENAALPLVYSCIEAPPVVVG